MIQLYSWSNKQAQIENAVQLGFSINFSKFFDITRNFLMMNGNSNFVPQGSN